MYTWQECRNNHAPVQNNAGAVPKAASLFRTVYPLVLASGSPRRQELLASAGILYSVRVSPTEAVAQPGENPANYALRAASGKGRDVLATLQSAGQVAVLAADTIVVLNGEILGKPANHEHAFKMLSSLAGQTHTVITACCLLLKNGDSVTTKSFYCESRVHMWAAPKELIKNYAYSNEPLDKAGSYAIQGNAGFMVREIEGSWSNVVGLPLSEVVEMLLEHNIIIAAKA